MGALGGEQIWYPEHRRVLPRWLDFPAAGEDAIPGDNGTTSSGIFEQRHATYNFLAAIPRTLKEIRAVSALRSVPPAFERSAWFCTRRASKPGKTDVYYTCNTWPSGSEGAGTTRPRRSVHGLSSVDPSAAAMSILRRARSMNNTKYKRTGWIKADGGP